MKELFQRNKTLITVASGTIILLIGGIFLFTRGGGSVGKTVNSSLLVPSNAVVTSGIVNGEYLAASSSASVTLAEFGDYECPACGIYNPFVMQLLTDFAGKINYVFRNYPLPQHPNALVSSKAVEAAGLQGKYWQMHEKVFETQNDWANLSDPKSIFISYARDLGLNADRFTSDIDSSVVKDKIQNDTNDGNSVGITATPTFYLNGRQLSLTGTYDELKNAVQSALSPK